MRQRNRKRVFTLTLFQSSGGRVTSDSLATCSTAYDAGMEPEFPVEVPIEEAELAKELLEIK